jgi:hypothetical protein
VILQPSLPNALPKELFHPEEIEATKPEGMALEEWKARLELAALYRVFHARGWDEVCISGGGGEEVCVCECMGLSHSI